MIGVDQTVFTVPGGNCFSACVATILGITLEDVPYFMGDFEEEDKAAWFERFRLWLKPHGYWPINFKLDDWEPPPDAVYILSAGSPRGDWDHSVVAKGGKNIVHDPHPSRAGLVRLENAEATFLIPFRAVSSAELHSNTQNDDAHSAKGEPK